MISRRFICAILSCGFLLAQLSTSLITPSFAILVQHFQTTLDAIKLIVTLFFIGYALGQLIWGPLSDQYGRRTIWRTVTTAYVLLALLLIWSPSLWLVYTCYFLLGICTAAYTSVGNAMVKDLFSGHQVTQAIAFIGVVMASGPALGAAISTMLLHWLSFRSIPVFMSLYSGGLLLAIGLLIPETKSQSDLGKRQTVRRSMIMILKNKAFMRPVLQLSLAFGTLMSFITVGPLVFHSLMHFSVEQSGWLMTVSTLAYIVGALAVMFFIQRWPANHMRRCAMGLLWGSNFMLLLQGLLSYLNVSLLLFTFILLLFALGMLLPLCKSACMQTAKRLSGTTASLMKFIQTMGSIIMTALCSIISVSQSLLPLSMLFILSLVIIHLVIVVMNHNRSEYESEI